MTRATNERLHEQLIELDEIADGAYSDGPMRRGEAHRQAAAIRAQLAGITVPKRDGYAIEWVGHGCGVNVRSLETGKSMTEERSLSLEMNADLAIDALRGRKHW